MAMSVAATGWAVVLMVMLGGNPSNELMDYIDTDGFWKAKGVAVTVENMLKEVNTAEKGSNVGKLIEQLGDNEFAKREAAQNELTALGTEAEAKLKEAAKSTDPEVATRAQAILKQLSSAGVDLTVRRLLAIRTLGELKNPKAEATLKRLEKSDKPFEAEYATRALAQIKGQAVKRTEPKGDELMKDVWMLPKGCGLVAHARTTDGIRMLVKEALEKMPPDAGGDKEQAGKELTETLIKFAETTGNIRVEALTLGVSGNFGPGEQGLFIVMIGRGQYDTAAVKAVMKKLDPIRTTVTQLDGMDVVSFERGEFNFILDGGHRIALVCGPVRGAGNWQDVLPVKQVISALKTGKGGILEDADMVKMINSVEQGGEVFGVLQVTESFKKERLFAAFETAVLSSKTVDTGTELKLVVTGKDAEAMARGMEQIDQIKQQLTREMQRGPREMKAAFTPLAELLTGAKTTTDGTTVTMTSTLKGKPLGAMLPGFAVFCMEMSREMARMQTRPIPQEMPIDDF